MLKDDGICFLSKNLNVLVIKREDHNGKLKIHVASTKKIYHFAEYKDFFNKFLECCLDVTHKKEPYVTEYRNLMFGFLHSKVSEKDVEIIVYPDSEVAEWAISKGNMTCIPYHMFVPGDFWNQLVARLI